MTTVYFSLKRKKRPTGELNSLLLNKVFLSSSNAYTCIMKFDDILPTRRRERKREKKKKRKIWKIQDKKKWENKESYKCSFFKHFIVVVVIVVVIVLLTGHEWKLPSTVSLCHKESVSIWRSTYKTSIYNIEHVPAEQSSFLFISLLFSFSQHGKIASEMIEIKMCGWRANKAYFRRCMTDKH